MSCDRIETARERARSAHRPASRFTSTTVMSSSCGAPRRTPHRRRAAAPSSSAAGLPWWPRTTSSTRSSPNSSPSGVAVLVDAVGEQQQDVARLHVQRHRRPQRRERHGARAESWWACGARTSPVAAWKCRIGPWPPLWKRTRCVDGSSSADEGGDEAVVGQGVGELVVHLHERGLEIGAQAERHAQHRLHLRDRERRRDAVAGGVGQHDEQPLIEQRQVERVAAGELRGLEGAVDVVARRPPASWRAACSSAPRAPSRAPGASSRLRSGPRSCARAAARPRTAPPARWRAPRRRRRRRRRPCSAPASRRPGRPCGRPAAASACSACGSPSACRPRD